MMNNQRKTSGNMSKMTRRNSTTPVTFSSQLLSIFPSKVQGLLRKDNAVGMAEHDEEFLTKFGQDASVSRTENTYVGWMKPTKGNNSVEEMPWLVDPDSLFATRWIGVVAVAVIYNWWAVIWRIAFPEVLEHYLVLSFLPDYICDVIYVVSVFISSRTSFFVEGLLVSDPHLTFQHYRSHKPLFFWMDILSLVPLDFGYFFIGLEPLLRLPRLLRVHRVIRFYNVSEKQSNNPGIIRISKLVVNLLLLIHWVACIYFIISRTEGFGSNEWVYPEPEPGSEWTSLRRKYVFSMFWSSLALTSIGETATPVTNVEYSFTLIIYFIGVFLVATVVGNMGTTITNLNADENEFMNNMDRIKSYMEYRRIPPELQIRVQQWYDYMVDSAHVIDEEVLLQSLPTKLRAEIAFHTNFKTLCKVTIFRNCEPGFLNDLVLKLRPQVFSPGDYICKKGEIGRDMFIIKHGSAQVVSDDGSDIYATLKSGSYFGEISVLGIGGGNRRTAHVVSRGFTDVFVLSRNDLYDTLVDYPDARKLLSEVAYELLTKDKQKTQDEGEGEGDNVGEREESNDEDNVVQNQQDVTQVHSDADNEIPNERKNSRQSQLLMPTITTHPSTHRLEEEPWEHSLRTIIGGLPYDVTLADVLDHLYNAMATKEFAERSAFE